MCIHCGSGTLKVIGRIKAWIDADGYQIWEITYQCKSCGMAFVEWER